MRGIFDDEEVKPAEPRRDKELILGSGTLLAIFFGLVLLCGLCFGLGYSVGHRNASPTASSIPVPAPGDQEPLQANASIPKPSAVQQTPIVLPQPDETGQAATAAPGVVQVPVAAPAGAAQNPALSAQTLAPAVQSVSSQGQSSVRPALGPTSGSPQPAPSAAAPNVHPAIASAGQFMVQIAAVTTPEDAEVLMDALRKRGYAVTVQRDLTDNLIHVRIGPFASRGLADQWRNKLLNDGYNAIVQP